MDFRILIKKLESFLEWVIQFIFDAVPIIGYDDRGPVCPQILTHWFGMVLATEYLDIFDSVCCHFKYFNPFQRSNRKLKSPFATTSVSCMSSGYPWCLWSSWSCWPPSWPSRPPWSPFVSSEVGQSVYLAGSRRWEDDCVFEGLVQHWKRTTGVEDSSVERDLFRGMGWG